MEKNKLLKPTNDYVFKRIFGSKGNEDITRGFVETVTGIKYEEITLTNTILDKDLYEDKLGILDVRLTANKNNDIDIEMQVVKSKYIADRILWYWAKLYSSSMKKGEQYSNARKAICILVADFKIEILEKITKFHTKWQVKESEIQDIVLTDKFEIHIIELGKLDGKDKNTKLLNWCKFINSPETLEESVMNENKDIKRAKEELDRISQDERERTLADLREKAIWDEAYLRKDGYDEGKEEGIKEGIKEGIEKTQITMIKNMLKENIEIELISKVTGLKAEEIIKIKEEK